MKQNIFEVERLTNLSNSLLDLLKNNGRPVKLDDNDIKAIASEAVSLVESAAIKKQITITNKVDKIKEYLVEELPEFNFTTGEEANQPEENHNSIRYPQSAFPRNKSRGFPK